MLKWLTDGIVLFGVANFGIVIAFRTKIIARLREDREARRNATRVSIDRCDGRLIQRDEVQSQAVRAALAAVGHRDSA